MRYAGVPVITALVLALLVASLAPVSRAQTINRPDMDFIYQIEGLKARYEYTGDMDVQRVTWAFGDGYGDEGFTVNYRYADYGEYRVTIEVETADKQEFTLTKTVDVPATLVDLDEGQVNVFTLHWNAMTFIIIGAIGLFLLLLELNPFSDILKWVKRETMTFLYFGSIVLGVVLQLSQEGML